VSVTWCIHPVIIPNDGHKIKNIPLIAAVLHPRPINTNQKSKVHHHGTIRKTINPPNRGDVLTLDILQLQTTDVICAINTSVVERVNYPMALMAGNSCGSGGSQGVALEVSRKVKFGFIAPQRVGDKIFFHLSDVLQQSSDNSHLQTNSKKKKQRICRTIEQVVPLKKRRGILQYFDLGQVWQTDCNTFLLLITPKTSDNIPTIQQFVVRRIST